MKITATAFKLFYETLYRENDKKLKAAPDMGRYDPALDVAYGDDPRQVFDLLRGKEEKKKNILLVEIHGGYYVRGRHRDSYPFALKFLDEGFDVCMVEYRLNGDGITTYDQLDDIAAFFRYLERNMEELGLGSTEKVFVTGDSAGGHLALYAAEALSSENTTIDLSGVRIDGVLLNCPSYDYASYRYGTGDSTGMKKWYLGERYMEPGFLERISPRMYIGDLSVPVFVSTCKNDFIRAGVLTLKEDLERLGKEHVFVDIDSDDKKVIHVHNFTDPDLPESKEVNDAMIRFMEEIASR